MYGILATFLSEATKWCFGHKGNALYMAFIEKSKPSILLEKKVINVNGQQFETADSILDLIIKSRTLQL